MAAVLWRRGPDAEGASTWGPVALGHRCLAVLDLSPAGAQRMLSVGGRWALVFDGEIYIYLELHNDLERDGAAPDWHGRSDMETLLVAIAGGPLDDPLSIGTDHAVGRMAVQDLRTYLPEDILAKVDRAAVAVSMETRVPFFNADVTARSARIPISMKVRHGSGKWGLRKVPDCYVPRKLVERPKAAFAIPVGLGLRGTLRAWAEDLSAPGKLAADGLLNPEAIRAVCREHLNKSRHWTTRLWIIPMFQAWRQEWLPFSERSEKTLTGIRRDPGALRAESKSNPSTGGGA